MLHDQNTGADAPAPIRTDLHETLTEAVYSALRVDIIRGVRVPGERLRIERLRRLYGIGPTPLREALQRLSADGLVEATGNRGFSVAPLNFHEFNDLNIARIAVEKEALRLSLARGDDEWEGRVVSAAHRMKKADAALAAGREETLDAWEATNAAFHTTMVDACGSRWLLHVRSGLNDQCERYRRAAVHLKRGLRDLGAEHAAIAEAVLARDAEHACLLVTRHYGATADHLRDALQRDGSSRP